MNWFMKFLLYSNFFDNLIIISFFTSIITTIFVHLKAIIKELQKVFKTGESDDIENFKFKTLMVVSIIIILLLFCFFKKLKDYVILIEIFIALYYSVKQISKEKKYFSFENKIYYIIATSFYIIFCSSLSIDIYINFFNHLSHFTKEIMLVFYITSKLILFVFSLLLNISVILANFTQLLCKISNRLESFSNKQFECSLNLYTFYFYKKYNNNFGLIVDKVIFILLSPITLTLFFAYLLILKIIKTIAKIIKCVLNRFLNFIKDNNSIIRKNLKISIIISLITCYVIIVTNGKIFSNEINNIYDTITTVILIPIVYDSLKKETILK